MSKYHQNDRNEDSLWRWMGESSFKVCFMWRGKEIAPPMETLQAGSLPSLNTVIEFQCEMGRGMPRKRFYLRVHKMVWRYLFKRWEVGMKEYERQTHILVEAHMARLSKSEAEFFDSNLDEPTGYEYQELDIKPYYTTEKDIS